jgi:hypothetical protein
VAHAALPSDAPGSHSLCLVPCAFKVPVLSHSLANVLREMLQYKLRHGSRIAASGTCMLAPLVQVANKSGGSDKKVHQWLSFTSIGMAMSDPKAKRFDQL